MLPNTKKTIVSIKFSSLKTQALILLLSFALEAVAQVPKHEKWDVLLREHVRNDGWVNYGGFTRDSTRLKNYLDGLSRQIPQTNWSKEDAMAYWINAYNAYTVLLILRHPGIQSIKDIASPTVKTGSPWDLPFIRLEGRPYTLNALEHDILRKQFPDPRIHAVLVCAARSCPRLHNRAYTGARLDEQLTAQSRSFLADPFRNVIGKRKARLSKIFQWYAADFGAENGVKLFLKHYGPVSIPAKGYSIRYLEYDWSLNGDF